MIYAGYKLNCQKHGLKQAAWTIDPPNPGKYLQDTFDRMHKDVTSKVHKDCKYEIKRFSANTLTGLTKKLNTAFPNASSD